MKASEWIDRVKKQRGWESDYRVSKELGLSRNTISNYRCGTRPTMDEDTAVKVSQALDEPLEIILIDQAAERTKSPEARSILQGVLKRLGGVAAGILLATGLAPFPNGGAGLAQAAASDTSYTSSKVRRRKPKARAPRFNPFSGLGAMPAHA